MTKRRNKVRIVASEKAALHMTHEDWAYIESLQEEILLFLKMKEGIEV